MDNVLLIGNGAREHAIAKQVVKSGGILYSIMDKLNPGIAKISKEYIISSSLTDFSNVFSILKNINFAIIGPEKPLSEGIVDTLWQKFQIPSIGPTKKAAQLENSKIYTRKVVQEAYSKANPKFFICTTFEELEKALEELNYLVAVKPDSLTGGKGVKISGIHLQTKNDIISYAKKWIMIDGTVLIEELLVGQEFTLQAFVDGIHVKFMPLAKDYKRAYNGDKGPNTGSMGAVTCASHTLPFLNDSSLFEAKRVVEKTVAYLRNTLKIMFIGVLYGQFMLTEENEIKLIEFNVRFGDPEALNVLSLLDSNFLDVCNSIINGNLVDIKFTNEASVCVYIVPQGYPENSLQDAMIKIPSNLVDDVFYASVYNKPSEDMSIVYTTGSRAIGVLAKDKDINRAHLLAMEKIMTIKGSFAYRKDIGYDIRC
jgi:phosphoribosylamine--glycine ligase